MVATGNFTPSFNGLRKCLQLKVKDGSLQIVQTRIKAPLYNVSVFIASVVSQQTHFFSDCIIIGHNSTAVAKATEDFGRIKTKSTSSAKCASASSFIL